LVDFKGGLRSDNLMWGEGRAAPGTKQKEKGAPSSRGVIIRVVNALSANPIILFVEEGGREWDTSGKNLMGNC